MVFSAFVSELFKVIKLSIRYFAVFILMSLLMLSLVTGEFPPPVRKLYETWQSLKPILNVAESLDNLKRAKLQRDHVYSQINSQNLQSQVESDSGSFAPSVLSAEETQLKIKRLEFEVAHLRMRLDQLEAEKAPSEKPLSSDQISGRTTSTH